MYEHVRYDLLADADGEESEPTMEDRPNRTLEEVEEQAFSFDSAFHYDAGADDSKYRTDANYNSAFKYSGNGPSERNQSNSVALNISNEDKFILEEKNRDHASCGSMITSWILTLLSYIFFVITSPIT